MADALQRLYEQVLVLRCQTGDRAAFSELVDRYNDQLAYYVKKQLGRAEGVDDILQDAWFDVFKSIGKLSDPGAFGAWLYQIVRMKVLQNLRRQRRHCELPEETCEVEVPDDDAFSPEDAAMIHVALDDLTPEHREVLLLRFIADMSYQDIAHVISCDLGTVRSRIHYAKLNLRRKIGRSP